MKSIHLNNSARIEPKRKKSIEKFESKKRQPRLPFNIKKRENYLTTTLSTVFPLELDTSIK